MNVIDAFLAPFYKWIILSLVVFITGYIWYCNSLAKELQLVEQKCQDKTEKVIAPYEAAIDQAKKDKVIIEKLWSDKVIEVEQNAIKQIQAANIDARNAQFSADGMSKQLSEANKRLSSAPKQTIINYTIANSELLESCTTEYRLLAEKADGHVIDVRRLNESWPEQNGTLN